MTVARVITFCFFFFVMFIVSKAYTIVYPNEVIFFFLGVNILIWSFVADNFHEINRRPHFGHPWFKSICVLC